MLVPTYIDSHLRIDCDLLGQDLVNEILDELTIHNSAKDYAQHTNRWGWQDLPDDFLLADIDGDTIILPRGYALRYKMILREYGKTVNWIDNRTWQRGYKLRWRKKLTPRAHQPSAVQKMIKHQQMIYQAPTGSGKSLAVIMLIQRLSPQKSIILVDKKDLLNQWIKNVIEWLGSDVIGQIGDGEWNDSERITIATVQSIWAKAKREEIDSNWFDLFDLVVADECHHVSAESIEKIAGSFSARMRIGVSATPDKEDDKFEITTSVLGPVLHEDDEEELVRLGVLSKPHVQVIKTDFEFDYWPYHEAVEEFNDETKRTIYLCQKPGCTMIARPHAHKDNYQKLKDKIVEDPDRNYLIASTVMEQVKTGPHHHLIVSDEVRHLDAIYTVLLGNWTHVEDNVPPVFVLTGRVNGKKRKTLIEEIEQQESAIILATVAKEGMDIPKIDRVYLPFPSASAPNTKQKVGRATRVAEGKTDSIVFDFLDVNVRKLKQQFRNRRFGFYDKADLDVIK